MLFVSPVFLFIFLPVSLMVYHVIFKNNSRTGILTVSIMYCLISTVFSHLVLPVALVCVVTAVAGRRVIQNHRKLIWVVLLSGIPLIAVLAIAALYFGQSQFGLQDKLSSYPYASLFYCAATISYLVDGYLYGLKKNNKDETMVVPIMFILYFPVTIAGPFLRYRDFSQKIQDCLSTKGDSSVKQSTSFFADIRNISSFTQGAYLFSLGFVKRIAIAETLRTEIIDAQNIFNYLGHGEKIDLLSVLIYMLMIWIYIIFLFSGWSDMACGLSYMFGIPMEPDFRKGVFPLSPVRFFSKFYYSFNRYSGSYLAAYNLDSKPRYSRIVNSINVTLVCAFTMLFCMGGGVFNIYAVILLLLVLAESLLFGTNDHHEAFKNKKFIKKAFRITATIPLRIVSTVILIFAFGNLSGNEIRLNEYVKNIGFDVGNMTLMLFATASKTKLLIVFVLSALVWCMNSAGKHIGNSSQITDGTSSAGKTAFSYMFFVVLLVLLAITIVFFMPQYPETVFKAFGGLRP